ncbi:hypothetical protein A4X13_0g7609 [Tilletia indica]|uniref:Uncharacterized protein n=1 Tax=Tilletia indica TaxID=43049 RepID=A0A8T8SII9_9BASI|nr:hypothetical protein A4X13_0g7609 [Tilletia indica]
MANGGALSRWPQTRTRNGAVEDDRLRSKVAWRDKPLEIQGVKMEGKAPNITVMISRCVRARIRQRSDGPRPAEGEGREDKACQTSDPTHFPIDALLPWSSPLTQSLGSGQRVRGQDPPPMRRFGGQDLQARSARPQQTAEVRHPQPVLQDEKSDWSGGRRSTKGLSVEEPGPRTDRNSDGKTFFTVDKRRNCEVSIIESFSTLTLPEYRRLSFLPSFPFPVCEDERTTRQDAGRLGARQGRTVMARGVKAYFPLAGTARRRLMEPKATVRGSKPKDGSIEKKDRGLTEQEPGRRHGRQGLRAYRDDPTAASRQGLGDNKTDRGQLRVGTAGAGPRPTTYETVLEHGPGVTRLATDGPGLTRKVRKTTANGGALSRCVKTKPRVGSVDDDRLRGLHSTVNQVWRRADLALGLHHRMAGSQRGIYNLTGENIDFICGLLSSR